MEVDKYLKAQKNERWKDIVKKIFINLSIITIVGLVVFLIFREGNEYLIIYYNGDKYEIKRLDKNLFIIDVLDESFTYDDNDKLFIDDEEKSFDVLNYTFVKDVDEVRIDIYRTETDTVDEDIDYEEKTVDDNTILKGEEVVKTIGVVGKVKKVYDVTYLNDEEIDRNLKSEFIHSEAVDEVTHIGTKVIQDNKNNSSNNASNLTYENSSVPKVETPRGEGGAAGGTENKPVPKADIAEPNKIGAFANEAACEEYGEDNYLEHRCLPQSDGSFNIIGINN